tara:strand:- start:4196 stop:4852 length:657 start_codon:yes stop_codon:yes gene_type:complete
MNDTIYGVFGASGFGREVLPLLREQINQSNSQIFFVDDTPPSKVLNGIDVVTFEEFNSFPSLNKYLTIAIADSSVREKLFHRCEQAKIEIIDVVAKNTIKMDEVRIGKGYIISPFCTLTSNIKIGVGFQANIYSYVAHDCDIGDFVTFAPSVKCNGNVKIENHAYIGTGAVIKQGRTGRPLIIGEGAVVGMGAVVTKNVPAGDVVVGNPAKSIKRKIG